MLRNKMIQECISMTEVRQDNGKQWSSFSIAAIFFVLIALAFLARGVLRNRRITQL